MRAYVEIDLPEYFDLNNETVELLRVTVSNGAIADTFRPHAILKEKPKSWWIPVSERLPKAEKKTYWICTDAEYQCECRWTNANPFWADLTTDWHWNKFDIPQYSEVIAWMPLPEPYKGGDTP